jgi:hypothetical protein
MGSELTLVFVVLFGVSAIWWTMMVLTDWLRHRRLQRSFGVLAMASATVVFLSLAVAQRDDGRPRTKPEYSAPRWTSERSPPRQTSEQTAAQQAQVDEMRRQFAPTLERYRQTHGYYPATLEEAGIATPVTLYGPLHYYGSQSEADAWYLISFGDIETDRFSADWDSRSGRWSVVELDF